MLLALSLTFAGWPIVHAPICVLSVVEDAAVVVGIVGHNAQELRTAAAAVGKWLQII
jgi:hypothetical protein